MATGLQSPQEVVYHLGQRATGTTPEGGRLEGISQVLPPHGGAGSAEPGKSAVSHAGLLGSRCMVHRWALEEAVGHPRLSAPEESSRLWSCPLLAYLVHKSPGGQGAKEAVVGHTRPT